MLTGRPRTSSSKQASADGVPVEWSIAPGADASRVLLYLHGGGFSVGSIVSHRAMVTETGRSAGVRTLAIDYRRTPEHPFPAALDDALQAYDWLLRQGVHPGRIAIGGDSAGGGLTLAVMVALRDRGLPLPACGWCISPWVDMEARGESYATKAAIDPMISKEYILELARLVSRWDGAADASRGAGPCRSQGSAPAANSGRQRRDPARQFDPDRRTGRRGRRSGHPGDLASDDSCMAAVLPATDRWATGDRRGGIVHPRPRR